MSDEIYRDSLTGLYNRRYLDELLPEMIGNLIQEDTAFTLVMLDLDNFKTVNDIYGHARGDAVLKSFARFLEESTRSTDKVIRYGGDEFICFMPKLGRINAELICDHVIRQWREKDLDDLKVSICIGLASFSDDGQSYQELFEAADASLYNAKRSGRDRVGTVPKKQITIPLKTFINRRDDLNTLLQTITGDEKRMRVMVINGNVGVGKTCLTREGLNLTKGREVIYADCLLFSETIAYYVIRELIKYRIQRRGVEIFDELPMVYRLEIGKLVPEVLLLHRGEIKDMDLVVDRYRLYASVHKSFEFGERTKVIIIDNFHWIDKESLEVLRYLVHSLKDTPISLVLLNRVEETPDLVWDFLAEAGRQVLLNEINLAPFPYPEVRNSIQSIIGDDPEDKLVDYAFRSSGGNPYFLEELFRGLVEKSYLILADNQWQFQVPDVEIIPKSVEQIALNKYKMLSTESQRVLKFSSITGFFDIRMLRHLTGYGESELQGLLAYIRRAGLMRESQGKLVFVDEFSRRAIYRKFVTGSAAQELHLRVAQKLEADHRGREDEVVDELAYNYYLARDQNKGVEYCQLAGQRAQEKYSNENAIRYYQWAEELLEGDGADIKRYEIMLAREKVYAIQGARDTQRQILDTLNDLVETIDDDRRRVEVALRRAYYGEEVGDYAVAIEAVQETIRLARSAQDPNCEAIGALVWGRILWRQGDYASGRQKLEQALTLARAKQLGKVEADSLRNLASISNLQGDFVEAIRYNEQALPIYREIDDQISESRVFNNLGIIFNSLGNYSQSRTHLDQALRISREIGYRIGEASALNDVGLLYQHIGEHEISRQHQQRALEIMQEIGDRRDLGYALAYLGQALFSLEHLEEAADAYQQSLALRRELKERHLAIESLAGLARVSLAQGNQAGAQAQVDEILGFLKKHTLDGTEEPFLVYLTCYHVLRANKDSRARGILNIAYHLLQERADKITDDNLRGSFLQNVKAHQEIVSEYTNEASPPIDK